MDATLHCNKLKCRTSISDQAVVTTCSHIFCLSCSDDPDLSAPNDGIRKCPACKSPLTNPDDAVVTSLNPTEDYKTSILSGLSPTVIIECAGRGLSFWSYQSHQEIQYQRHLAQRLATKYEELDGHLRAVTSQADAEHARLEKQLNDRERERDSLVEQLERLKNNYRERDKQCKAVEHKYLDMLRQKQVAGVERAAERSVDHLVQRGAEESNHAGRKSGQYKRSLSNGSHTSEEHRRLTLHPNVGHSSQRFAPTESRAGVGTGYSQPVVTPNANRSRLPGPLPQPAFGTFNASLLNHTRGAPENVPRRGSPRTYETGSEYGAPASRLYRTQGLSAGMKAGREQSAQAYVPASSRAGLGSTSRPVHRQYQ